MNLSLVIPISVLALAAGAAIAWQVTKAPTDDKPAKAETPADAKPAAPAEKPNPYVLKYTMKLIDEKTDKNLKDYEGKVVLMVNVASKCGYTKQYKGIEKLYETYKDKGLVILGFPANDFGGQEPGSNSEIQQFCTTNYSVTFPMFAKIAVTGDGAAPLFKQLTALDEGRPPSWNFNKYLIGKDGKYIAHYESRVKPDDVEFIKAVRDALGIKADEATPAPATSDKK